MASLFRDPILITFVDTADDELLTSTDTRILPRVGENVRIRGVPYRVVRIGFDIPDDVMERVWVVCAPA